METRDLKTFKDEYKTAIDHAKPILNQHSGWKRILQILLNAVNALFGGLGCSSQGLHKLGLFLKPPENSEKLTTLEQHLNQL